MEVILHRHHPPARMGGTHTRNKLGLVIKRAERIQPIGGFGIDRVAAAADEAGGSHGGPVLRMENLDTDLPLPPEALEVTRSKLEDPSRTVGFRLPATSTYARRSPTSPPSGAATATIPGGRSSSRRAEWKRFSTSSSVPWIPVTR